MFGLVVELENLFSTGCFSEWSRSSSVFCCIYLTLYLHKPLGPAAEKHQASWRGWCASVNVQCFTPNTAFSMISFKVAAGLVLTCHTSALLTRTQTDLKTGCSGQIYSSAIWYPHFRGYSKPWEFCFIIPLTVTFSVALSCNGLEYSFDFMM